MAQASSKVPLSQELIDEIFQKHEIDPEIASIREMVIIMEEVQKRKGLRFLRMEMGIPGLDPSPVGIAAEREALKDPRLVATYCPLVGIEPVKKEGARFAKAFLNLDIPPLNVVPTVGSMQGGFLSQAVTGRATQGKDRIVYVDPCFSVHRIQTRFLGLSEASVDLYDRDHWLEKVEAFCKQEDVAAILYSSPNNPTWNILTEEELRQLGEICTKYDVIALEDAAYLGMDFRRDYSVPSKPPFIPTVASYTDNYILLLSASKIFSYAGQRAAMALISPKLGERKYPGLKRYYGHDRFFNAFVLSALYCVTASVPVGPQYAMAAMLKAATDGEVNFLRTCSEYADRAAFFRKVMGQNGFKLVYDQDKGEDLSNGFYFTFSYKGFSGGQLVKELLRYGISATTLKITHSCRAEAVRACTSLIGKEDFDLFEERIRAFHRDHPMEAP